MTTIAVRELLRHRSPLSSHVSITFAGTPPDAAPSCPPLLPHCLSSSHECSPTDPSPSRYQRPSHDHPRLLLLLDHPRILLGRIQLSNAFPSSCSPLDCLAFSDESATVCCVLQEADPQILGRLVRVLSWSFIPKRGGQGGCLELRHFEQAETGSFKRSIYLNGELASSPNLVLETPPVKQKRAKSRVDLSGCVVSISAPFFSPHGEIRMNRALFGEVSNERPHYFASMKDQNAIHESTGASQASTGSALGFFVGLTVCSHIPTCTAHDGSTNVKNDGRKEILAGDLTYIYFSGSPASWRPMLLTLSGKCVSISDLRKKILLAAPNAQYITYAATSSSIVSLLSDSKMQRSEVKSLFHTSGGCKEYMNQSKLLVSYIGVVSGMFVNGRLLELDGCIWLLLVHQPLSHVHGLRVGATIAAYHVHSLRLKSSSECPLLLATCSVSHVVIVHFSPYSTLYAGEFDLRSSLNCFIESLSFQSAFRALQIITSFKLKFGGFYKEKEILGSAKKRGIAETYMRNMLTLDTCGCRDTFNEVFSHDKSCRLAESACDCVTGQVPSINNFCKQVHVLWLDENSFLWKKQKRGFKGRYVNDSGNFQNTFVRIVLSSDMLGITLVGILQFSKLSGSIQLVDATGVIDVLIPELQTAQCFQESCQVSTYNVVIEGYLRPSTCTPLTANNFPLSCRDILKGITFDLEDSTTMSFFLIAHLQELRFIQRMEQINPYHNKHVAELDGNDASPFHMLFVLHKYPMRIKRTEKSIEDTDIVFCLEAVRLPYTLQLLNEHDRNEKVIDTHGSCLCMISKLHLPKKCPREPGSRDRMRSQKQHSVVHHYSHHLAFLKDESQKADWKKLLLQFKSDDARFHQVIHIGQCYLIKCSSLPAVVMVDSRCMFSSVAVVHTADLEMTPDSSLPLVDMILKLPLSCKERFDSTLAAVKLHLARVLSVSEVLEQRVTQCIYSNQKQKEICGLLKGSLISFTGEIENFQSCTLYKSRDMHREGLPNCFFMKDLNISCSVKVNLDLDFHVLPTGFGPGAIVTMHRILLQLSPEGDAILQCIPPTLILINNTCVNSCMAMDKNLPLHKTFVPAANVLQISAEDSMKVDSFTDFSFCAHVPKLQKIQGQVAFVERILFEKVEASNRFSEYSQENEVEGGIINYRIPSVFFIIDNGYGMMYCCAKDDVAASILKVPTQVQCIRSKMNSSECMIARELNVLLKKYGMIMMGNENDTFNDDSIVFRTGKDAVLHVEEKKFLYRIVRRACCQGLVEIIGEHCMAERPSNDFVQPFQNNYHDIRRLLVEKVESLNYERYLGSICGEVSDALAAPSIP